MFTKVLAVEFIEKQQQKQQQRSDNNETNVQRKSTTSKLGERERRVEEYGGKITRKIEVDDDERVGERIRRRSFERVLFTHKR